LVIPIVISVFAMAQASQIFPMVGKNLIPHMGHRMGTG